MLAIVGTLLALPICSEGAATYRTVDLTPPGVSSMFQRTSDNSNWGGGFTKSGALNRATVWELSSGQSAFLDPLPGFDESNATGVRGANISGYGQQFVGGYHVHAVTWNPVTHAITDLHPNGASYSAAYDTDGTRQVGYATFGTFDHAIMWNGSANDYVDLTPLTGGYSGAVIRATDGQHQGGYAVISVAGGGVSRAMLWSGTAQSAVDLNPGGKWYTSFLDGVFGDQQVGSASDGFFKAALWRGTAASFVNLHPAGRLGGSGAIDTNDIQQVGYIGNHAYLWNGSAESALDLHQFLEPGFTSSVARSIDANGNIYGSAIDTLGNNHAVAWLVPEPSVLALAAPCATTLLARRRRRH
jgi:hypothetical protein